MTFATANLFRYVEEASAKRRELGSPALQQLSQIETKSRLHAEAEAATAKVKALADCLIAFELRGLDGDAYEEQRTVAADARRSGDAESSLLNFRLTPRTKMRGRRTFQLAG